MRFIIVLIFTFSFLSFGDELKIPALTGPVVDRGNFLSESERKDLSETSYEIFANQGPQITILTVPDLQGFPIEEFSIRVAEKWQLGSKEKDNGLLILIAKSERKVRIEVGNGIEGEITDYYTSKFTHEIFPPLFKRGQFYEAINLFLIDVAEKFNIKLQNQRTSYIKRKQKTSNKNLGNLFAMALIIPIIGNLFFKQKPLLRGVFTGIGFSGLSYFLGVALIPILLLFVFGFVLGVAGVGNVLYQMSSGYGGRTSGGSGGGWSGGGGGFSGGGSSGSW